MLDFKIDLYINETSVFRNLLKARGIDLPDIQYPRGHYKLFSVIGETVTEISYLNFEKLDVIEIDIEGLKAMAALTDDQYLNLVEACNSFSEKLGKLAAEYISKFPLQAERQVTRCLQDRCSIYVTDYIKYVKELRD